MVNFSARFTRAAGIEKRPIKSITASSGHDLLPSLFGNRPPDVQPVTQSSPTDDFLIKITRYIIGPSPRARPRKATSGCNCIPDDLPLSHQDTDAMHAGALVCFLPAAGSVRHQSAL